jgi:hypothetical protein
MRNGACPSNVSSIPLPSRIVSVGRFQETPKTAIRLDSGHGDPPIEIIDARASRQTAISMVSPPPFFHGMRR